MNDVAQKIQAATSKEAAVEYLALVERSTVQLADQAPKSFSEDYNAMVKALRELSRFAWALGKFPVFDPSVLNQKKELPVTARIENGAQVKLNLVLPVFQRDRWSEGSIHRTIEWWPSSSDDRMSVAEQISKYNVSRQDAIQMSQRIRCETVCPAPPKGVRERVASVQDKFDRVDIAWEAEYRAELRIQDPLVIGVIGRTEFLIDEYDASKLERYIASEFTRTVPK